MTTTRRSHRAGLIAQAATVPEDSPAIEEHRPAVSRTVRDAVYWSTLGVAACSALASGISGIWFPEIASDVAATGGVLTTVMGIVGGGVGVIYRPGAQH